MLLRWFQQCLFPRNRYIYGNNRSLLVADNAFVFDCVLIFDYIL